MLGLGAEEIATVIVGIATALTVLLGGRKAKQARQRVETSDDMVEVAGALINGDDARALSKEFRANIEEKVLLRGEIVKLRRAVDANTEACEDVRKAAGEVTDQMKELWVEMVRSGRK
ncbi:hypothetical protein D1114_21050 [Cereibacter sphaeroides]|uniref:Uncharacterized protein n=1 Tax=Cereibacter sphaeroides TaxID=1063 RepID=A0AAX1UFQ0_CERSP|nr:hypothetical protein [Cereibacter sphaeroides]RHZ91161.1 hypothetical protein D1114_21050 [Cereibacter sphaeroides]